MRFFLGCFLFVPALAFAEPVSTSYWIKTEKDITRQFFVQNKNASERIGFLTVTCNSLFEVTYRLTTVKGVLTGRENLSIYASCGEFFENLPNHSWPSQISGAGDLKVASGSNDFDRMDLESMNQINEIFHRSQAIGKSTTNSLHHGKRTEEVYVFIPGVTLSARYYSGLAAQAFLSGRNVIYGTLPGQELYMASGLEKINPGTWLMYAEYLARLARSYGKKVIFIGQSTGAHLAIRMAEMNLVHGIVLAQPLVKNTWAQVGAATAGSWLAFKEESQFALYGMKLTEIPYQKINPEISVRVFLSDYDPFVYNPNTRAWAQSFAPQAKIEVRPLQSLSGLFYGHMNQPSL
jgi:pimeloyl-ACP methyl ester carboxylesterase